MCSSERRSRFKKAMAHVDVGRRSLLSRAAIRAASMFALSLSLSLFRFPRCFHSPASAGKRNRARMVKKEKKKKTTAPCAARVLWVLETNSRKPNLLKQKKKGNRTKMKSNMAPPLGRLPLAHLDAEFHIRGYWLENRARQTHRSIQLEPCATIKMFNALLITGD